MINAKEELLEIIKITGANIKCAFIKTFYHISEHEFITLKVNHTDHDYGIFLSKLNFYYDSRDCFQYIDGFVWLNDGTFLCRDSYDGDEWWKHITLPEIPKELLPDDTTLYK